MSVADSEDGSADGLSPINLIDCSLEDLVAALLHGQPIAMPEGGPPFVLENDNAARMGAAPSRAATAQRGHGRAGQQDGTHDLGLAGP